MAAICKVKDIARHPPAVIASPTSPIYQVLQNLTARLIRHAYIVDEKGSLLGVASAKDIINFLGGGWKYRIVKQKYSGELWKALCSEPIESIMTRRIVTVNAGDSLVEAINSFLKYDVGAFPVLDEEGRLWGSLSERHIMKLLAHHHAYVKVSEIMSKPVLTVSPETATLEAMKLFIKYDIRRLPLVKEGKIEAIVTVKDILRFFTSEAAKPLLEEGKYRELLTTPVSTYASKPVVVIDPDVDVGEAAAKMAEINAGCLPVVDEGKLVGIVTERDFLLKLPKVKGVEIYIDTVKRRISIGRVSF